MQNTLLFWKRFDEEKLFKKFCRIVFQSEIYTSQRRGGKNQN